MSIHLISTDRFGRRSYLIFSFYIIQNSLPKVNYPSRLVPIPFGVPIPYIPHPSFPSAWLLLPALFSFLFSFHTHPYLSHPLLEPCMYLLAFFHYGHVLSESMLFSRVISNASLSNQAPGFTLVRSLSCVPSFSSLFLPFFFQI